MKIANVAGRAALVLGEAQAEGEHRDGSEGQEVVDVHDASDGCFGPDPMDLFAHWDALREWASGVTPGTGTGTVPLDQAQLACPVPRPRQVFAIGLNYRAHAEESGAELPTVPATFTKFPASLSGPFADVPLEGACDWEVELVAVVGATADHVSAADGWDHVAGLTVGQDISDRVLQFSAGAQFSLGKSRPGFGPMGPWLVTPDELADPDDLALGCAVDGETVQDARTSDLVFSVPRLVAELSAVLPLWPGDVIFTGTPAGIGATRQPPRFLQPGQVITSWIEGIGTIRNRCT